MSCARCEHTDLVQCVWCWPLGEDRPANVYNLGSVAAQRATIGRVDSSSAPDPLDGEQGQGFGGEDV